MLTRIGGGAHSVRERSTLCPCGLNADDHGALVQCSACMRWSHPEHNVYSWEEAEAFYNHDEERIPTMSMIWQEYSEHETAGVYICLLCRVLAERRSWSEVQLGHKISMPALFLHHHGLTPPQPFPRLLFDQLPQREAQPVLPLERGGGGGGGLFLWS